MELLATRRFSFGGIWHKSFNGNGFLSSFTVNPSNHNEHFQFLVNIATAGVDLPPGWVGKATETTAGKHSIQLKVWPDGLAFDSVLVVRTAGATLTIYEESRQRTRTFTPLALSQLNMEFNSVLSSNIARTQGFDPAFIPKDSVQFGSSEMHLANDFTTGLYQIYAYVNPGEDGQVYLKLFKGGGNTPIGDPRDYTGPSTEKVGWSSDPHQQFFYNTMMTMDAGGWTNPFVARFEMWFTPSTGKPDRKLLERYFSVRCFE
jgi:hypothetical protein